MKKLFFYPAFQIRLILWNALVTIGIFIMVLVFTSMTFSKLFNVGVGAGFSERHPYFDFVQSVSGNLYGVLAVSFIVGILISAIATYFVTRKYARSMFEIKTYFSSIRQTGNVTSLEVSKNNHFADFADEVNGAIEVLKKSKGKTY